MFGDGYAAAGPGEMKLDDPRYVPGVCASDELPVLGPGPCTADDPWGIGTVFTLTGLATLVALPFYLGKTHA